MAVGARSEPPRSSSMRGRRISAPLIGQGKLLQKVEDRFAGVELGRNVDVGGLGFECGVHAAQRIQLPGAVGVEKGDAVAVGVSECSVARGNRPVAVLEYEGDALGVSSG